MKAALLVLLVVTMVGAIAITVAAWRRRDVASRWLVVMSVGIAVWAAADTVIVASDDVQTIQGAQTMTVAGITGVVIGVWWWTFVLAGWDRLLDPLMRVVIIAPGVITTLVLLLGNPYGLVWEFQSIPPGHYMTQPDLGPMGLVHRTWSYLLLAAAGMALLYVAQSVSGRSRRLVVAMLTAIGITVIVSVVVRARLFDLHGYDPSVIASMLALGTFWFATVRLRTLEASIGVLPVARSEVVDAMSEGVVVLDESDRVLDINPSGTAMVTAQTEPWTSLHAGQVLPGWDDRVDGQTTWEFEAPGSEPPAIIEARIEPIRARRATIVLLRDMTRQRTAQAALERSVAQHVHASRHDPLTGLPNRVLLFSELRDALGPQAEGCALFILDLNGFKGLNDTFGHRAGDRVLRELATRLETSVDDDVLVARLDGDEFAVMTTDTRKENLDDLANVIMGAFLMPFRVADNDITLSASMGMAIGPQDGADADDLVHAADVAMYHAKRSTHRWAVYEPGLDGRRPEQLILRHDFRRALESDELVLNYQPLANASGQIHAVEALVRWRHPSRGLLFPDEFLGVIEDSELMCRLTDAVLDKAIRQIASWNGERPLRVSVNLAALDLRDPTLAQRVTEALAAHGAEPSALTLEVTENALVGMREIGEQLDMLRETGVRVALDDFGTGIGPLSLLRDLAVDEIKIDRSFVSRMIANPRDTALVRGLIRLGHDLGLSVVAEGVETDDEFQVLVDLGCDLLQGYLIGKPVSPDPAPVWYAGV